MIAKLIHGPEGHPLHPPLTGATIGMFVLAGGLGVVGKIGWIESTAGPAMWLALVGGLIVAVPTALTGLADWLTIERGTDRFRTATLHLGAMVTSVVLFLIAAVLQRAGYNDATVTTGGLILALVGVGVMGAGGWLGGAIVYVHGMRVKSLSAGSSTGA